MKVHKKVSRHRTSKFLSNNSISVFGKYYKKLHEFHEIYKFQMLSWDSTREAVTTHKVDNLFKGGIFKSISRGLNIIDI